MKKLQNLGRLLSKSEQKQIKGGNPGTCISTCWYQSQGGEECGHVEVPDCSTSHSSDCKTGDCANGPKTTCSCG